MPTTRKLILLVGVVFLLAFVYNWLTSVEDLPVVVVPEENRRSAIFAGGCFWCMEPPFENLLGVVSVESGYIGGDEAHPTYEDVAHGRTGHVEAIRVTYDASRLSYDDLLSVFWRQIDPTDDGGQFVDRGASYRSAIYVADEHQRRLAERSKDELARSKRFDKPPATTIRVATTFWVAEEYHQDYYRKNPLSYKFYRSRSGRDRFLDKAWGSDRVYQPPRRTTRLVANADGSTTRLYARLSEEEKRTFLTPLQYRVTQEGHTEPAFGNEHWNNTREGIYVDVVSGEPLFSSRDKIRSKSGWPTFRRPLDSSNIVEKANGKLRSKHSDSHLGRVLEPNSTEKLYRLESAALRFVPVERLEAEGYPELVALFPTDS